MADGQKAVIDEGQCTGCGICVDVCSTKALEMVDDLAKLVRPGDCDGRGECVEACPVQCITLK
ncbi:MAG: 4Fe-4S binding protein [Candidatus Margulisbacteria bacterium]|nr:4Fe-4S binding protein [Candidatus Margulisiibacteriota bacterium]